MKWAEWFEKIDNRRVKRTKLSNGTSISTIFLGIDHGFSSNKLLLFETMAFEEENEYMERYSTFDESIIGHDKMVKEILRNGVYIIKENGEEIRYTKYNRFEIMDI